MGGNGLWPAPQRGRRPWEHGGIAQLLSHTEAALWLQPRPDHGLAGGKVVTTEMGLGSRARLPGKTLSAPLTGAGIALHLGFPMCTTRTVSLDLL